MNIVLSETIRRSWKWVVIVATITFITYQIAIRAIPVSTEPVEIGEVVAETMGTGTLEAHYQGIVSAQIQGPVAELLVDQNDWVKRGQLLARIDDSDLKREVTTQEAVLKAAEATVERADADEAKSKAILQQARLDYDRYSLLLTAKTISQEQLDRIVQNLSVAEADLARAKAAIAEASRQQVAAEERLRFQQARLAYTRITSPFDGLIIRRDRELGDIVVPGASIFLLVSKQDLWISAWVDESSMAGLAAIMTLYHQQKDEQVLPWIRTYVSFLKHSQTETGHFHNFMSYDRRFQDDHGSDDTLGRVLWGLGTVVRWGPKEQIRALAQDMMDKATPRILELEAPRAMAYAIIGMDHLLQKFKGASKFRRILVQLADDLVSSYKGNRTADWHWFEEVITYGNAKIPEALLRAYQVTQNEEYRDIAVESLNFLTKEQWNGVYFELVGNEGWYPKGGETAFFGQQPIDAAYLVEAYVEASGVSDKYKYLELARLAFEWFLGRNRLNVALYDFADGSVADGIDSNGISVNQGAESVVCYLLAVLALSEPKAQRIQASK